MNLVNCDFPRERGIESYSKYISNSKRIELKSKFYVAENEIVGLNPINIIWKQNTLYREVPRSKTRMYSRNEIIF